MKWFDVPSNSVWEIKVICTCENLVNWIFVSNLTNFFHIAPFTGKSINISHKESRFLCPIEIFQEISTSLVETVDFTWSLNLEFEFIISCLAVNNGILTDQWVSNHDIITWESYALSPLIWTNRVLSIGLISFLKWGWEFSTVNVWCDSDSLIWWISLAKSDSNSISWKNKHFAFHCIELDFSIWSWLKLWL